MASQDPATNPNPPVDTPAAKPPATDPPAADPMATDPPAGKPPATDPPTGEPPATDPPAGKPPATDPPTVDLPRKAGQLTPAQKKDIIYKIVDHDGQGLPDILPKGFALTIGEVKAILNDPVNRKNDDVENKTGLNRKFKCETALSRFRQYKRMGLKDENLWEPGLGAEITEWKGAASLDSKGKEMLLQIADVEIEHATDIQDVIPPNFKLKPSEILDILYPASWPDDAEKAEQALTKMKAAIKKNVIEENQPLESSRDEDEDEDEDEMKLAKQVCKNIFRAIARVNDLTAMSDAIETNLAPNTNLAFKKLVEMADPDRWSHKYDKDLAQEAKKKIHMLVPPAERQSGFIFQHREKRHKPPTLLDYHKRSHQGMTPLIEALVNAVKADGRDFINNHNAKAAAATIEDANTKIKEYNAANNLASDTGVVNYLQFCQMWLALKDAKKNNEVEAVLSIEKNLKSFCETNALPKWYPHDDDPKPNPPKPSNHDTETRDGVRAGSYVELWGSKAIAYVPSQNTEPWEYRPGYTPHGEKIEYRQRMGAGIYFVVHGPQGWRLTPSGSVGGKLARQSAEAANIQWALNAQEASRYLYARLCQPGRTYKYDVWFVAIGQLNLERKIRVPNMIVGFVSVIDGNPETEERVAIPRTALDQFLGKDTAEALALAIGYRNAGADSASLRPLTQRGKVTQEQRLMEGLRNLCIDSPQEFDKLMGTLGLVRADRRLEWKG
ncbi:uncharacterized protein BDV17DRAFT_298202 [Aspergillus undulatus]|uniref:uncharacterized protein n=1 Tax=Aspergillus undulatus TaxID=1810928 RepID=UPI003CCD52EA